MATLQEQLDAISGLRARGTTLVTLLIPTGAQVARARQHIVREMSEAGNVKCRVTRQHVLRALRSAKSLLDGAPGTSPGLAMFAGCATTPGGSQERI